MSAQSVEVIFHQSSLLALAPVEEHFPHHLPVGLRGGVLTNTAKVDEVRWSIRPDYLEQPLFLDLHGERGAEAFVLGMSDIGQ